MEPSPREALHWAPSAVALSPLCGQVDISEPVTLRTARDRLASAAGLGSCPADSFCLGKLRKHPRELSLAKPPQNEEFGKQH